MTTYRIGQKLLDKVTGELCVVTGVTIYEGSAWYDVRIGRGESVRFPNEVEAA